METFIANESHQSGWILWISIGLLCESYNWYKCIAVLSFNFGAAENDGQQLQIEKSLQVSIPIE